jgi:hypothetical protein
MLREALGEHSLSRKAVFEWHSHFKASQVSAEDDEHSARPSTSKTTENVESIRGLIHKKDHHRAIHMLADTARNSYGVCQMLTENLNIRHIDAKFVPPTLNK